MNPRVGHQGADDDEARYDQAGLRLRLQGRRLPLQPLHLQDLRLLTRKGRAFSGRGPFCRKRRYQTSMVGSKLPRFRLCEAFIRIVAGMKLSPL